MFSPVVSVTDFKTIRSVLGGSSRLQRKSSLSPKLFKSEVIGVSSSFISKSGS